MPRSPFQTFPRRRYVIGIAENTTVLNASAHNRVGLRPSPTWSCHPSPPRGMHERGRGQCQHPLHILYRRNTSKWFYSDYLWGIQWRQRVGLKATEYPIVLGRFPANSWETIRRYWCKRLIGCGLLQEWGPFPFETSGPLCFLDPPYFLLPIMSTWVIGSLIWWYWRDSLFPPSYQCSV